MGVGLRAKSQLGVLPYIIQPKVIEGRSRSFAKIKCDHKGCDHEAEISADATGRLLPLEVLNKKFSALGWHVRRHHNRCPEHNGKARKEERKVLSLASVPERFKQPIVANPVEAVRDVAPIKPSAPNLSHVHESKVGDLTEANQLAWYKQAFERERSKTARLKKENTELVKVMKPIADQSRLQFSGMGVVWDDEVSWADRRGVSLNINFEHLKNVVRAVDGQ